MRWSLLVPVLGAALSWGCGPRPGAPDRTPLLRPPAGITLRPGPPDDVYWLRFVAGRVPSQTTGGLSWDDDHGLPDPYAVLSVDGERILTSGTQRDTLTPTWPESQGGNYQIDPGSTVRVELLDDDTLRDQPIANAILSRLTSNDALRGHRDVDLGHGRVRLAVEPAHAMFGLGFDYRKFDGKYHVFGVYAHSPASRSGLRDGDVILKIEGKDVAGMTHEDVQSWFNAVPAAGLRLVVLHDDDRSEEVTVGVGPVYPLYEEYGGVD